MITQPLVRATHPASSHLYTALGRERTQLARALAIEADWRYHDGPELALRFRAAKRLSSRGPGRDAVDSRLVARTACPALGRREAEQARRVFRRLLGAYHPRLAMGQAMPSRIATWRGIKALYRRGDLDGLVRLETELCATGAVQPWPLAPADARREWRRLRQVRTRVDRRLDAMRRRFPFNCREQLFRAVPEAGDRPRILSG